MRLKILTTVCLIGGVGLLFLWPWLLGARPEGAAALRAYSVKFAIYTSSILVLLLVASIGAVYVARQAREEYARQLRENMKMLVEGALTDHAEKEKESHES